MLAAVARDRGSERGVTALPEAGSRGHAPSATNAEVKFSGVGGHIRGARHGRQQRLVGGPGGDPHLGGYLGRRPEGWQRRRGAQSQPRLRPTPAGRKSGSTLPPFDLRIIRLCISTRILSAKLDGWLEEEFGKTKRRRSRQAVTRFPDPDFTPPSPPNRQTPAGEEANE